MQLTIAFSMYFDVIDHAKLLAFFEVVCGGSWFAKKEYFYVAGVPVRMERSPQSLIADLIWKLQFRSFRLICEMPGELKI